MESNGNKIEAGTLEIKLYQLTEGNAWSDISDSTAALFNSKLWEPGYTAYQVLKVENDGTLALKWKAQIVTDTALNKLAEVIDVYTKVGVDTLPSERGDIATWTKEATLLDFINNAETKTVGRLGVGQSATLGIALKMREEAGNEYQGLSLGAFDVKIVATQDTVEKDSFNELYDAEAEFPGYEVEDAEQSQVNNLAKALATAEDGDTIYLAPMDFGAITLGKGAYTYDSYAKNLTIVGAPGTKFAAWTINGMEIEGWTIKNVTFCHTGNVQSSGGLHFNIYKNGTTTTPPVVNGLTVENCKFVDGASLSYVNGTNSGEISNVLVKGCEFSDVREGAPAILLQHINGATVENCTFTNVSTNAIQTNSSKGDIKFLNNTINGTGDRALRFANKSAAYIITGNTINSNGDENGELMKISGYTADTSVYLTGTTWNGEDKNGVVSGTDYVVSK